MKPFDVVLLLFAFFGLVGIICVAVWYGLERLKIDRKLITLGEKLMAKSIELNASLDRLTAAIKAREAATTPDAAVVDTIAKMDALSAEVEAGNAAAAAPAPAPVA